MPVCFPLPLRLVRVAARDDMVEDAEEGEEGTGGVGGRGAGLGVAGGTAKQTLEQEGCGCSSCSVESICVGIDSISKLLRTKLSQYGDLRYWKILLVGSVLLM